MEAEGTFELSDAQKARIAARWPMPRAFYGERDDRTSRAIPDLHAYAGRPIEIHVDPAASNNETVQRIALIATNLSARWARRVTVVLQHDVELSASLRRDHTNLGDRLMREMITADPFGEFSVRPEGTNYNVLRLFVGPWRGAQHLEAEDYVVHASAWTVLGRRSGPGNGRAHLDLPGTVAAAGLAGSLGAADLFKRAIGHATRYSMPTFAWDTWSSALTSGSEAWDYVEERATPQILDLGRMLLAGVGAIGSAFVYLIDLMPILGKLTLFDRDAVDATNLNRSPLFTVFDALNNAQKIEVARTYLEGRITEVNGMRGLWRDHASTFAAQPFDVWISMTNEDGAWAELPFQLPPVVLHGTTTSGWGLGAGRHIPHLDDCTLCRMPRPHAEFRGPCAEGVVAPASTSGEIRASLPFLSTAAASLLLGIYTQLNSGDSKITELANGISVDLSVGLPAVIAVHRGPTADCRGCRASKSNAWEERGGRGRFRAYSH